ncbi:MAG: biopolymer transporter ExbD [Cyanobacteria bacterium P01_A01_bin.45]
MKININSLGEDTQIQILPLIDVVFCILTFFLLAATQFTRPQGINIDLPKAKSGTSASASQLRNRNILPITIDAVGLTYVEKEQINKEQLTTVLKKYLEENPEGTLVLNASRAATYNDVIGLLDLLRQVGGDRVSLGIIPGSPQAPTGTDVVPTLPGSTPLPNTNPNIPTTPQNIPLPGAPNPTQPQPRTETFPLNPNAVPPNPNVPRVVPTAPASGNQSSPPSR